MDWSLSWITFLIGIGVGAVLTAVIFARVDRWMGKY